MKKLLLVFVAMVICATVLVAQAPQAFKYQAVIRDYNGKIIADQDINLKISILKGDDSNNIVYSEIHPVLSNSLGLVTIEVGRGLSLSGSFPNIDWAEASYFIKIEMDEYGGQNYRTIGLAQLLSVPYALHSGTASSLVISDTDNKGIPAQAWSLFGNSNSGPPEDKLGTTDNADLMMVTNNIERLRIKSDGDVEIARSLNIGENLTVEKDVLLNTMGGETTNYGPFTVANLSPTLLSGELTVDLATDLNSSLNVDGVTNLNSSFNVTNNSSSVLTGSLLVNKDAIFNENVTLDNADLGSETPETGALVVAGGVGIGENLNVGGKGSIGGDMNLKGILSLTNITQSDNIGTGALTVAGGVGIAKNLNVGGATTFENKLDVNGQVIIHADLPNGKKEIINDYPLIVKGGNQGIAVKVNHSRSSLNNFISFWDDNAMWGRIEGQRTDELWKDPEYHSEFTFKNLEVALYVAELIISGFETTQGVVKLSAAGTSSTACVGLGACITAPIPSLIVESSTNLVLKIANGITKGLSLAQKVADLGAFTYFKNKHIGVTYSSGSADYAEWLPKEDPKARFAAGEVVGLKNGFVTKDLATADKIMAVSTNPIVLGNMPPQGQEDKFVKIAFMGQVPVKVAGNVQPGDYILPSEIGNGFGKAVHPDKMELKDYKSIVGVAWSDMKEIIPGFNMVNVAVGINSNDLTNVILKQEEKYNTLRAEFEELKAQGERSNAVLAQLIPGFAEATGFKPSAIKDGQTVNNQHQHHSKPTLQSIAYTSPEDIIYFEIPREQVEASLDIAREIYIQGFDTGGFNKLVLGGIDRSQELEEMVITHINEHPFWSRIDSDLEYRKEVLDFIESNLERSLFTQRKYAYRFAGSELKLKID
jgi:hypothetical protein